MTAVAPDLLPRPRRLRVGAAAVVAAATEPRVALDHTLAPQGYRLRIDTSGVTISHADDAGLRYARQTLDQVRAQSPDGLPELEVDDAPDLAQRGYMLDISRDRVPTRATLERLVEILALVRINHLELYTEHTFAYRDHEVVWRDADPLTADDIAWLDGQCRNAGITLVANQNCFGHMERWLRHDEYRSRAECPDGFEVVPGFTMPPAVLAPTADNAEFARGLLRELVANFTSRAVNIGCDETFELGRGVSRADCAARGTGVVFAEHVLRIAAPLLAEGREVLFWADMVRSHPEGARPLVRDGLTPVAWTYEAPPTDGRVAAVPPAMATVFDALGLDLGAHRGFAPLVEPLLELGVHPWVAPGTSTWNSLVGRLDNALANIDDAVRVGLDIGAPGLLLTDWGDNGHLQPPAVSLPPIVAAGASSWCHATNHDLDLPAALDRHVFGDATSGLGGALDRIGRQWQHTGRSAFNCSPLQVALLPDQFLAAFGRPDAEAVARVVDELDDALAATESARPTCRDGAAVVAEVANATRLARHGAWVLARRIGIAAPDQVSQAVMLADDIDDYRACWLARCRPGGLRDSAEHLQRALARLTA